MDLALFDFDGTVTIRGTLPDFVKYAVRPRRKMVGGIVLAPVILGYRAGLVSSPAIRKALVRVAFSGDEAARVRELGVRFAREVLPGLLRPAALDRIEWHRGRGDRVVIVSGSLDVYLEPWCASLGIDVISTQLEARHGVLTGRYAGGDCCGAEKSRRIRARHTLASYGVVHAYGDTEEDREMLEMADRRHFRWREVREVPPVSRATRRGDGGP